MTRHFFSHRTTAAVCTVYPDIITLNANQFSCLSINRSCSIESSGLSLSATMTNMPRIWVLPRRVFYNIRTIPHALETFGFYCTLENMNFFYFFFIYASPSAKPSGQRYNIIILKSTLKFLTHTQPHRYMAFRIIRSAINLFDLRHRMRIKRLFDTFWKTTNNDNRIRRVIKYGVRAYIFSNIATRGVQKRSVWRAVSWDLTDGFVQLTWRNACCTCY